MSSNPANNADAASQTHLGIAALLAMTTALGPLAIDTYLPAFPAIADSLGVNIHRVSLESKFSEWLTRKPVGKLPFKEKYFVAEAGLWAGLGLPGCQQLAGRMQAGQEVFQYLDAPQLLKHALGLATHLGERFTLHYLYCDWAGEESAAHQAEIERFASGVDEHLGFTAVSYQQLYARLCEAAVPGHSEYLRYLDSRYFRLA